MGFIKQTIGIILLFAVNTYTLPYENEYSEDYGEKWITYLDDNGTTHIINLTTLPEDVKGWFFGDVYFYLYTQFNNESEELIIPDDDTPFISRYFNKDNDIKVITHGWLSSTEAKWLTNIRDAILRKENVNVIAVDWSELAGNPIYPWSAGSTKYVGRRIAKLLNTLTKTYNIPGERIHLIGHSLGAQVMGFTGMLTNSKVARITALDPARPFFEIPHVGQDFRLEKSDANFVDIIHTCGGFYGYKRSHGDADYYPNNGKPKQPGCEGTQNVIEACSHARATHFFAESIESDIPFIAYPCESWNKFDNGECNENPTVMGYRAFANRTGDFYLHTNDRPTYAKED